MTATTSPPLEFLLNGRAIRIGSSPPQTTLLDFLRAQGLTGAKEGCAEGECGTCAVVMVDGEGTGSAYRVVNSCLMFLPMAVNREIYRRVLAATGTVRVQQAWQPRRFAVRSARRASLSFVAARNRPIARPVRIRLRWRQPMRCTVTARSRKAAAGNRSAGPREIASIPAPALDRLVMGGFSRPSTVEECVAILARDTRATLVAGCTDLGVESHLRHRRWPHLVSVEAIDELHTWSETPTSVTIGAAVPLGDIERRWRAAPDVWREWFTLFASARNQNRAPRGGNRRRPPVAMPRRSFRTNASLHTAGPRPTNAAPVVVFTGYRQTGSAREILTAIEIPQPLPEFLRFYKVAKRRLDDISTVAAAMALDRDPAGRIRRARFAFGGVAPTPLRIEEAERAVIGQAWSEAAVERVQHVLDRVLTPMSDHRGSAAYRLEVSKSLVEKFWWEGRS